MAYNLLGEKLINPTSYTLVDGEDYYPFHIAKNIKEYYKIIFYVVPSGTIICLLLTFQYKPDLKEINISPDLLPNEENDESKATSEKEQDLFPQLNDKNEKDKKSEEIKMILKNRRVWILSGINFCAMFLVILILNTFKTIGATAPKRVSASMLTYTAVFCAFALSIFGPLWGFLIDKVNFKIIMIIINGIGIGLGVGMVFGLYVPLLFCFLVGLAVVCVSGVMSSFHPHIMRVFGIHYSMIIGGVVGLVGGFSNLLGSIFTFVISSVFKNNQIFAYGCVYVFGALLNLVALLLTFFESNEPFDFDKIRLTLEGDMYDKSRDTNITQVSPIESIA